MRVQITRVFAGVLVLLAACTSAKPNVEGEVDLGPPPVAATQAAAQIAPLGTLVLLDGSASTDPAGLPLQFDWRFVAVPAESTATLSPPEGAQPNFVVDMPGTYTARLVVSNGKRWSQPSTFTVVVAPVVTVPGNAPPVAKVQRPLSPPVNSSVTLDGSLSRDPEGKPLTYAWGLRKRPQGSRATLQDPSSPNPTMMLDVDGEYLISLTVRDDVQPSRPVTVRVVTKRELLKDVTYRLNPKRTGAIDGGMLKPPLKRRWYVDLGDQPSFPLVTADMVYVFSGIELDVNLKPVLHAISIESGTEVWRLAFDQERILDMPYVTYSDGTLYLDTRTGVIRALNAANGDEKWKVSIIGQDNKPSITDEPLVATAGKIYLTTDRHLVVLDQKDGSTVGDWVSTKISDSIAAVSDGVVFIGGSFHSVFIYDPVLGSRGWVDPVFGSGIFGGYVVLGSDYLLTLEGGRGDVFDYSGKLLGQFASTTSVAIRDREGLVSDQWSGSFGLIDMISGQTKWRIDGLGRTISNPLMVNGEAYVQLQHSVASVDLSTGVLSWADRTGKYSVLTTDVEDVSGFGSNSDVLVVSGPSGLIAYESDPEPRSVSTEYKDRCGGAGNQLYLEGDRPEPGVNGQALSNGDALLEGSVLYDKGTAYFTGTYSGDAVQINVHPHTGGDDWFLSFGARFGELIALGKYPPNVVEAGLKATPVSAAGYATTLPWGSCSVFSNEFEITQLETDQLGLKRFSANLIQHCDRAIAALRGCVKWERPTP